MWLSMGTRGAAGADLKRKRMIEDELRCPICWDSPPEDPRRSPCGHSFCRSCIMQALSHKKECPVCRSHVQSHRVLRCLDMHDDTSDEAISIARPVPLPPPTLAATSPRERIRQARMEGPIAMYSRARAHSVTLISHPHLALGHTHLAPGPPHGHASSEPRGHQMSPVPGWEPEPLAPGTLARVLALTAAPRPNPCFPHAA
jgi:hypothetical protein